MIAVVAVAMAASAPVARLARGAFLEVLKQDHILAARARGIGSASLWLRHIARNALHSVIGSASLVVPAAFASVLVVEDVLGLGGLGNATMAALRTRDLPWLIAFSMLAALLTTITLIVSDIALAVVDPRIGNSLARTQHPS